MFIEDKKDKVFIPQTQNTITANDYNQIKNEIQECISLAGLTPTKDVIQFPQALEILTEQSGAEEVAKIEAAGQEQLNAINTAGAQAVQNAQDAAATATSKAAEAAESAENAAESASAAAGAADDASNSASAASSSATSAASSATQAAGSATAASNSAGTANTKAGEAASSASAALTSQQAAASSASSAGAAKTAAETAKTQAASSASAAANSASSASSSATLAQNWAVKTDGAVSGGEYSAKYHAQQAASSASAASTAKTAAQTAQSAAETAKTQAADSASSANASASTATTKATEASASASQAAQSAIDAANSAASARGLQIGSVYFSQSNLATDNPGALPLWTGEYFINGSSLYPDFYNWVKSHTELCKTKTQYDAAISTYGECPYYVVDEVAGSLRLPKLANYLKVANDTDGITQAHAGLPNITGTGLYWEGTEDTKNQLTGCFFVDTNKKNNQGSGSTDNDNYSVAMDVSRSSAIYGGSDTVTPAHTTLYPWIYAFNSAVSASVAQAAEFTESLTGKAAKDLSNGSKATQANINNIMPDDMDYVVDSYSDGEGNWYRVYKSGWLEQGGKATLNVGEYSFLKPFSQLFDIHIQAFTTGGGQSSLAGAWLITTMPTNVGFSVNYSLSSAYYSGAVWAACGQGA